jgi:methionyl-tRNA formyltransferase
VLGRLADSKHRPLLVVTPPDSRRGRGRRLAPPPVAERARELGIELLQTADVNEPAPRERIAAAEPEVAAVCAFGQLLGEPLLSELPMLNVHPSLLPRWRGAAPIERAIMARDRETGVTILRVTAELDSGPIALAARVPVDDMEDAGALAQRLAETGGELLIRALDLEAAGKLELREQSEDGVTYAEKLDPAERRLDPSRPAAELAATVRALTPEIGAYLELNGGDRLGVRSAQAEPGDWEPGALAAGEGELHLGTGEGLLRLDVVQPPGGKPTPVEAYLRGHALPPGARAR